MMAHVQGHNGNSSRGDLVKDMWHVVREGSLVDVELALKLFKKKGGDVNSRNVLGVTPLHIAVWRNHIPIVKKLLLAGADPGTRDGESGWSSLHRALYFGHLAVASVLLQHGASITREDYNGRTPIDLLSGSNLQVFRDGHDCEATEVFSWGSGANYQLGTGNVDLQKVPCKVDALHGSFIKMVSAAKFHSVAVSERGDVYSWGFGRGGRLGHPDFNIHSGQAAVITPCQVISGLGSRHVKAIAAAKHHTVLATDGGGVFTWGSNREGQLGYSVDTQPIPHRVSSLKFKIIAVAAANKHTAAVSDSGEVFTWGCNREGQLGYGTSNSASNTNPRIVDFLKGTTLIGVAAAKHHTIVLGSSGDVYTWGHRLVTPRRVNIARNCNGGSSSKTSKRLPVCAIAAGMTHSIALTNDGELFFWVSSDRDLRCHQLLSLSEKDVVSISAGKCLGAAVTSTGDVYMWEGKKGSEMSPAVTRLHGVKRATSVSVGEAHLLVVASLYHPISPVNMVKGQNQKFQVRDLMDKEEPRLDGDTSLSSDSESESIASTLLMNDCAQRISPTLKHLCEKVAAESLVVPQNALQMLEIAASIEADDLLKYCQDIVIHNLDYILTVSTSAFANASPDVLIDLEKVLRLRSSEPWSCRRLPTPTATLPVVNDGEEDGAGNVVHVNSDAADFGIKEKERSCCFLRPGDDEARGILKQIQALQRKLLQIEILEEKLSDGDVLDHQQLAKIQTRSTLENLLVDLGAPFNAEQAIARKGLKLMEVAKKQRRKMKQRKCNRKGDQMGMTSDVRGAEIEANSESNLLHVENAQPTRNHEEDKEKGILGDQSLKEKKKEDNGVMGKGKFSKRKERKGGLSMFLSGTLDDDPPKCVPPPLPPPKLSVGPAWGGVNFPRASTSLREIQDEQKKTMEKQPRGDKLVGEHFDGDATIGKVQLGLFFPSEPIPLVLEKPQELVCVEKSPPWASKSPLSQPSLRDIQIQQQRKQQQRLHVAPKPTTIGSMVVNSRGSPSDSAGTNRWFKPEMDAPSSIRSIQIEERAMKDLRRFYSSVRVVKNPIQ